ncbi:MAG: TetR/AcrR family transcriptional regulator [Cyclobacteriaceae bacterium]
MKNKKNTVIEVATKLFAEQGFENTSVAKICEVANVSKGLVYHHFKSKDEILEEIFTSTTKKMMEMNKAVTRDSPKKQLTDLITAIFSQLQDDKLFYQLNLNIMFQPSTKKLLSTHIKDRSSALLTHTKEIFNKIDPAQSTKLSYIFIAEIDGVSLNYLSVFENYPLEELRDHLIYKYRNL